MNRRSCIVLFTILAVGLGSLSWFLWGWRVQVPQKRIELNPVQTEGCDAEEQRCDHAGYAEIVQNASQIAAEDGADFQLYVAFSDWDTPYVMNSRSQSSASIIKIYILGAVLELSDRGVLDLDQKITVRRSDIVGGAGSISGHTGEPVYSVYKLLDYMITESDNTATNVLIDTIGMDTVQDFIVRHGFTDTVIRRKMMDFRALQEGRDNLTSISDVGKFFSLVCEGRLVSPRADGMMIDIFLRQTDKECLNSAIPDGNIAHKTGELAGVYHDVGIVYHESKSYVLCIMTNNSPNRKHTLEVMRRIAAMVDAQFWKEQ